MEKEAQIGAAREVASDEFIANTTTGTNSTWANGFNHAAWFTDSKPVFPNRLKLTGLNRILTKRLIYAYVWCSAPNSTPVQIMLECRINFYLGEKTLLRVPITYAIGYNLFTLSPALGITRSKLSAPLAGGIAGVNTLSLALIQANTGVINPESTADAILLQPFEVDFQCDKITLDVLGGIGANLNDSRFVLVSIAP